MTVNGASVLIPALVPWHNGVALMRTMSTPSGWTGSRWQQACTDATALLDSHGAELLALGWSAADVFGLYPQAPGAVDVFGLALLLDSGTVAELTATVPRSCDPQVPGSRCSVDHGDQQRQRGK
jgi:hypothetical protein